MTAIDELFEVGTSTWLDDLSRERIETGNLAEVKKAKSIVGVTTNPAIFATAMSSGTSYDTQLAELKTAGSTADAAVYSMSIKDVQDACDLFRDTYEATGDSAEDFLRLADRLMGRGVSAVRLVQTGAIDLPKGTP